MQVCIDVTYMYTDFSGRSTSGFEDTATLKSGQISLSDHGLIKKLNQTESAQKIHANMR